MSWSRDQKNANSLFKRRFRGRRRRGNLKLPIDLCTNDSDRKEGI